MTEKKPRSQAGQSALPKKIGVSGNAPRPKKPRGSGGGTSRPAGSGKPARTGPPAPRPDDKPKHRAKKRLGQNFLRDTTVIAQII